MERSRSTFIISPLDIIEYMFYYYRMKLKKVLFSSVAFICSCVLGLIQLISSPRVTLAISNSRIPLEAQQLSSPSLSRAYPQTVLQWENLILRNAQENHLDPNLIAAVILQESGGQANAYSASGAVGLMQIMPHDGIAQNFLCNGKPCFRNRPSIQELYDPSFNIAYGSRMLANLIKKYGDQREALYHYGPIDVGYRYADSIISIYETYR